MRTRAVAFLEATREVEIAALETAIADGGGEVLQRADGIVIAAFGSASACLRVCASLPDGVRVGSSCGDVLYEDGLVYGLPVIEASRLMDFAAPGQIVCAQRLVGVGDLPIESFRSLGELEMRGFEARLPACELLRR